MLIVTLVAIVLAICQLDLFVKDWRQGNSNCELHNLEMDTIVVHGISGPAPSMMPEFFDAMESGFPNCHMKMPDALRSSKRGKIYVCPVCQKNYEAYK